jgi:hypothetical protein
LSLEKQNPSFPYAFGGGVVHGRTDYGAKDANPVNQFIQFNSHQYLHNELLINPDSSFSMDFHPLVHMRHIHVPLLRQKNAGMTVFYRPFLLTHKFC